MLERGDLIASEADRFAQPQPGFDAALTSGHAVMIEDALHPFAAHVAVGAVRHDGGILLRNVDLVVITVCHPGTNLLGCAFAAVHCDVIGVMDMVVRAFGTQLLFEFFPSPGGCHFMASAEIFLAFCGVRNTSGFTLS